MTVQNPTVSRALALPARLIPSPALFAGVNFRQLRPVVLPIATAGAVLLLWQAACALFHIPRVILPAPSEIGVELWRILPVLLHHAVPTTLDSITAFFV